MGELPLDGVNVLDLSRLLPGGMATLMLSDLGASVTKVELPPQGDHLRGYSPATQRGMGAVFNALNRDKRSVVLDYRELTGRGRFLELLNDADVLVENFRPGTLRKYELDYEALRVVQPALVYASVTGYGQTGAFRDMPAHGLNLDAAAGRAEVTRTGGDEPVAAVQLQQGLPFSVRNAGVYAALGITAALYRARGSGTGCHIDVSCWDVAVAGDPMLGYAALNGVTEVRRGYFSSNNSKLAPYVTADGQVMVLCPIEPHLWVRFCEVVDRPDLLPKGDVGEWDAGSSELYPEVARIVRTRTLRDWEQILSAAGVPASPTFTTEEALNSELAADRGVVLVDSTGHSHVASPLIFDGVRGRGAVSPAPTLGEHTSDVLGSSGS